MNAGSAVPSSSDRSAIVEENMRLVLVKIGAMIVLGVGSLTLGMLPLVIGRCGKFRDRDKCRTISSGGSSSKESSSTNAVAATSSQGLLTSLLLCFGGGVLLFTTFLHLAPEVRESVERHQSNGQLTNLGTLSMAELLFCVGFFLVYLVEETVDATLSGKPETSEDLLYRTVSVRRSSKRTTMTTTTTSASGSWHVGRKCPGGEGERINDEKNPGISMVRDTIDVSKNDNVLERGIFVRSRNSIEQSGSTVELASTSSSGSTDSGPTTIDERPRERRERARNAVADSTSSVRGLMTVVALSFHAIFEGLAVGLEPSITSVVYLATAIATHKLVIAFCVGMELHVAGASTKKILGYLSIFSLVSPLGIAVGLALGHFDNETDNLGSTPTILQGMAAGTLLYVVFFEVLARERANDKSGLLQLAAIILGFVLMLGLQLATAHSHSHGHSHGTQHDEAAAPGKIHSHRHTEPSDMGDVIERITESVAEAVSNVLATSSGASPSTSTTTEAKFNERFTLDVTTPNSA